ncbi:unnamed protein product [Cuscuta campestris]|uniref:Uncharacterized protein n=1 Tax=Cuscuta campestris TaxID=132261 RepID=A0A484N5V7_9ASTE|nr:unnamed protein product [Cuscuta campestris]
MVMQYHSVENGFRLPLRGLLRNLCRHFGFAPGQLTANAHKYVASYILRCCALDRTPTLDEFLILFIIGGSFPFYSLYPHSHAPIFERFHLRTKFATAHSAEEVYNVLGDKGGLIPHHSLQDARLYQKADFYYPLGLTLFHLKGGSSLERSKAPPALESGLAGSSSGVQTLGNFTALAIRKPTVSLEAVPISAIPGLRRPTPSQKRPRERVTDDDFLPKKSKGDGTPASPSPLSTSLGTQNTTLAAAPRGLELPHLDSLDHEADELPDQAPLKKPAAQPQHEASHWTIQANMEKMKESLKETTIPQARPDLLALNALYSMEQAQQSLLTLTEEYLGGALGNYRAVVALKEKELAARALQQKVDSLEQQVQALQEEDARLKENGSMELAAERSRVKSLQEQIVAYQRGTQDLETQFDRLQAQISTLESKASASEDKVGSLKAELVERESRISELESSLQEAKVIFIDLTISNSSSDSSSLAFPSLGAPTPELSSRPSLASEQSVTSPLPMEENNPHLPPQVSWDVLPGPGALPNSARTEVFSGCLGTSRPQKRRHPHSGASRLVSGARPSSQGSPSPQQSYGQPPEEWGDYDMGGNRLPFIRREKDGTFQDPPPPSV